MFNWRFKDLDIPGVRYALSEGNGLQGALMEDETPFWLNYVTVDNVEQAGQKAQRLGAKVLRTRTEVPGEGAFVVIADPSGARLALWEQAKK
jgi:predicted enzyme related to lactoylglutathione lyase